MQIKNSVIATFLVSASAGLMSPSALAEDNVLAGLRRLECYEPERQTPKRVEEAKKRGASICAVKCYDEALHSPRLVKSRKARGAEECKYKITDSTGSSVEFTWRQPT